MKNLKKFVVVMLLVSISVGFLVGCTQVKSSRLQGKVWAIGKEGAMTYLLIKKNKAYTGSYNKDGKLESACMEFPKDKDILETLLTGGKGFDKHSDFKGKEIKLYVTPSSFQLLVDGDVYISAVKAKKPSPKEIIAACVITEPYEMP